MVKVPLVDFSGVRVVYYDNSGRCCFRFFHADTLYYFTPVPGGLGDPRAYQNQFREFNSHRVPILVGTSSCTKIDERNAREGEMATFDENRRAAVILNEPYAR